MCCARWNPHFQFLSQRISQLRPRVPVVDSVRISRFDQKPVIPPLHSRQHKPAVELLPFQLKHELSLTPITLKELIAAFISDNHFACAIRPFGNDSLE
jgi:hypothetical protein